MSASSRPRLRCSTSSASRRWRRRRSPSKWASAPAISTITTIPRKQIVADLFAAVPARDRDDAGRARTAPAQRRGLLALSASRVRGDLEIPLHLSRHQRPRRPLSCDRGAVPPHPRPQDPGRRADPRGPRQGRADARRTGRDPDAGAEHRAGRELLDVVRIRPRPERRRRTTRRSRAAPFTSSRSPRPISSRASANCSINWRSATSPEENAMDDGRLETLPVRRRALRLRRRGAEEGLARAASRRLRAVPRRGLRRGRRSPGIRSSRARSTPTRRRRRCNRPGAPIIAAISPRRSRRDRRSGRSAPTPPTRRPTSTRPISRPTASAKREIFLHVRRARRGAAGGGARFRQRLLFPRPGARPLLAGNLDRQGAGAGHRRQGEGEPRQGGRARAEPCGGAYRARRLSRRDRQQGRRRCWRTSPTARARRRRSSISPSPASSCPIRRSPGSRRRTDS